MTGIFNGIQLIINCILPIFKLIGSLLTLLGQILVLVLGVVIQLTTFIQTMPNWLIAYATCSIGIVVIYQLIGRESGK